MPLFASFALLRAHRSQEQSMQGMLHAPFCDDLSGAHPALLRTLH